MIWYQNDPTPNHDWGCLGERDTGERRAPARPQLELVAPLLARHGGAAEHQRGLPAQRAAEETGMREAG